MAANEHIIPPAAKRYESLPHNDECSRTFVFGNEDHTLGNALRHVLMCRQETTFCGYSVPHPSEPKMNLRLQTSGKPSVELLIDGLQEVVEICDLLDYRVDEAIEAYTRSRPQDGTGGGAKTGPPD